MSTRITENQLQHLVGRINTVTGAALEPYTGPKPNALNYHISFAYGGVSLHQMGANGSGTRDVFGCGHVPKPYLYDLMHAYLSGLTAETLED
jgi:hypothetical protein